jgi:hypothetical protein
MIVASGNALQGCESLNVTGLEFESRLSPLFFFIYISFWPDFILLESLYKSTAFHLFTAVACAQTLPLIQLTKFSRLPSFVLRPP